MSSDEFYRSSLDDIDIFIKKIKNERKRQLRDIELLSDLITQGTALVLNGSKKVKVQRMTDIYKDLFEEDIEEQNEIEKQKLVELNKARMIAWSEKFNSSRKEV